MATLSTSRWLRFATVWILTICATALFGGPTVSADAVGSPNGQVDASPCLYIRSGAAQSYPSSTCIPDGTFVPILCTVSDGQSVLGPYGYTKLWDEVSWNGATGLASDAWIFTNTSEPVAPACTTSPPLANSFYDRSAAVNWALANAQDPQAYSTMCAWFVSNALWAGGFPRSSSWTGSGNNGSAPGSFTAWNVVPLKKYLMQNFSVSFTNITSYLKSNAVPQAEPGDIIFYNWGQGEGLSHVAIVVSITSGDYPVVAEWSQFDLNLPDTYFNKIVHVSSPYVDRGWTWSQVKDKWLQQEFPNMQAYLLHINGGVDAASY